MKPFKQFKKATKEELFMYFLFVDEFKKDLFVPCDNGTYMPDENTGIWYALADDICKKHLKLKDITHVDGGIYTSSTLWEFLREMWKIDDVEAKWTVAEIISERWGEFER